MNGKKVSIAAIAGGVFLLLAAGGGYAKPILQDDFSATVSGMNGGEVLSLGKGRAWRGPGGHVPRKSGGFVVYDLNAAGLNPLQGTIELDVTRDEVNPCEAMFSLADATGDRILTFELEWEGGILRDKTRPLVTTWTATEVPLFTTPGKDDFGFSQPSAGMYLNKAVSKGQTTHFALSWGPQGLKVTQDGAELRGTIKYPEYFLTIAPLVKQVIIGGDWTSRLPDTTWCTSRSPISNVQVHDVQLSAGQLSSPIDSASIASVTDNAFKAAGFSGKLVAGDKLQVTVAGTPGATGSFDIAHFTDLDRKIVLDWQGYGTYLEEKKFFEAGEVDLRDVDAYRVYVGTAPIDPAAPGIEPVAVLKVQEQTYTLENLEPNTPYYTLVVAEMRDGTLRNVIATPTNLPLAETSPGVYGAAYGVGYQDRYPKAVIVGHLARGNAKVSLAETVPFTIDPALTIAVSAEPNELKADEKSVSNVSVTVTDANGNPVAGHKVKFLLATTSQYTGVVGGGAFAESVGGALKESAFAETDLFGKLTTTYVAGFAAKTAVIVARDMASNSTGAGYVKTYIQAAAELELEPVQAMMAMDVGYRITVTSSDEWLTADGKSQARITAKVTLGDNPVEGHRVTFAVSSGAGSIRVVSGTTDKDGAARAVYTAGKKIGLVLITATDTTVNISGSVQIELRSDAPAKIAIKIDPEKLPADGRSRATISLLVTDINDNPNDNTEVEYRLASGGGSIRDAKGRTDKNGESSSEYVAGETPGKVSIEITVRSTVPTDEELGKARNLALAVTDYDFF